MQPRDEQENMPSYGAFECLMANLEKGVSNDARSKIDSLINEFTSLRDTEKLMFCLLLPTERSATLGTASNLAEGDFTSNSLDINNLGVGIFGGSCAASSLQLSNQIEQSQAYTWIMSHLEEDQSTCLRKDEVYEDYRQVFV